jgi:hypothetical protein
MIRKQRLPAQMLVVLLVQLAHNILLWARSWLSQHVPCLHQYGIVRLIGQVWAIPGRIKLTDKGVQRVRLRRAHPRARDVCCGFRPLLANSHIEVVLASSQTGAFGAKSWQLTENLSRTCRISWRCQKVWRLIG